jgi:hypothetical protein
MLYYDSAIRYIQINAYNSRIVYVYEIYAVKIPNITGYPRHTDGYLVQCKICAIEPVDLNTMKQKQTKLDKKSTHF